MDEDSLKSRISRISTVWTMLADAHQAPDTEARAARLAFIRRYQGAAYRYLLGATRDPDAADELFQEFALRFVQGAFRGADPKRGRLAANTLTRPSFLSDPGETIGHSRPQGSTRICPRQGSFCEDETPLCC
ncbi:MAG: hypothetical protein ABIP48_26355 [Planctomycetota bacterium]